MCANGFQSRLTIFSKHTFDYMVVGLMEQPGKPNATLVGMRVR